MLNIVKYTFGYFIDEIEPPFAIGTIRNEVFYGLLATDLMYVKVMLSYLKSKLFMLKSVKYTFGYFIDEIKPTSPYPTLLFL